MTGAISVSRLTKRFGEHVAVNEASFEVPYGAVTGFVGANGSGKTTILRSIVGLTMPTSGSCRVAGSSYRQLEEPRQLIGSVLDRLGGHPGLSGRQHLSMVAESAGIADARVTEVLDEVGLADAAQRKLGTYSTGMKQRLSLATALLAQPRILLLDEPASGLDPAGISWLRKLLKRRASEGGAIFVSTHQLAELATIVEHIVVIDQGQILAAEPTSTLLERTAQPRLEDAVLALTMPSPLRTS